MIWLLLILFQVKHFVADYPLQGQYMLGKFKKSPDFVLPLLAHVSVHAGMTFLIAVFCVSPGLALGLALLDAVIHFVVDRVKASPDMLGRFKPLTKSDFEEHQNRIAYHENNIMYSGNSLIVSDSWDSLHFYKDLWNKRMRSNKFFWWALGADQSAHHLTHYLIIAIIMGAS